MENFNFKTLTTPCPFCGHTMEVADQGIGEWFVYCWFSYCPIKPETQGHQPTAEAAIEMWESANGKIHGPTQTGRVLARR